MHRLLDFLSPTVKTSFYADLVNPKASVDEIFYSSTSEQCRGATFAGEDEVPAP